MQSTGWALLSSLALLRMRPVLVAQVRYWCEEQAVLLQGLGPAWWGWGPCQSTFSVSGYNPPPCSSLKWEWVLHWAALLHVVGAQLPSLVLSSPLGPVPLPGRVGEREQGG